MKHRELIQHLEKHGCEMLREGGNHSWWTNHDRSKRSAVPRHSEVNELLARKICRDLGVLDPRKR